MLKYYVICKAFLNLLSSNLLKVRVIAYLKILIPWDNHPPIRRSMSYCSMGVLL